jgi:hypothetical protein
MKRLLICCMMISFSAGANGIKPLELKLMPIQQFNAGIDLAQFTYNLHPETRGLNAGLFAQYKPFYFLGFHANLIYNNVRSQGSQDYYNLFDYQSRGTCLKLGSDLSLRLGVRRRDTRAFIGGQVSLVRYEESGRFQWENYWGEHDQPFNTGFSTAVAGEFLCGLQFQMKKCIFRTQFYIVSNPDNRYISSNDSVLEGYKSPFIPGLGYWRRGLNLVLLYKFLPEGEQGR